MKRLPFSIIVLLIFLAFFYNIKWQNTSNQSLIDISSFVYLFGTAMVVFNIMLKFLRRTNCVLVILGWVIVFIVLKIIFFKLALTWGGQYSYVTLVDILLISLGAGLSYYVGWNLNNFEDAVEKITFDEIKRAINLKEATEMIKNEIYRSRRYNHPMTILMVQPLADSRRVILNRSIREVQDAMISRYMSISMARALYSHIRRTDILVEQPDKGRFIVVSPETDKSSSGMVVGKIQEAAKEIGAQVVLSQTNFPDDALTLEELLNQSEIRLAENLIKRKRKITHGRKGTKTS